MLDTCLLALYASMVPVVFLQFSWLADWINVYHSGAVACFMWVSDRQRQRQAAVANPVAGSAGSFVVCVGSLSTAVRSCVCFYTHCNGTSTVLPALTNVCPAVVC